MGVVSRMREDIQSVFDRDPAARTTLEVVLVYPGLHAIWAYRVAHWLWEHNCKLLGRLVSEYRDSSPESRFIPARKSAAACSSIMAWAS